jgi:pyruvate dehydrogenase E2 component (dihydrolipoamide acetyltransferase)
MAELRVVRLANLHPRMDRNTIVNWLKREGEQVRRHEPLYVVETRKSTYEVCSEDEGVVDLLLVPQGARVAERQELALIRLADGAPSIDA